ncbi:GNAT family N-acetyltransferase [Clostridia bacterium OttesenSCG-928-F22]|nr:GNAT family N-acetyltransferase [Clostridia bacterium OttesenSCG-928-F22]
MCEIRNLENTSFEDLAAMWNLAYSDYIVPMHMTPEGMEAYIKVTGVDREQSFGAFHNGALVGALFNSIETFKGEAAAYDAMTGIAPEYRGNGLFSKLFEHTKDSLKTNGITQYYLEVITTNERAYAIYKKKGGKVIRELSVLKGKMNRDFYTDAEVTVSPLSAFPKEELAQYELTFANRIAALHRNIEAYQVACAKAHGKKAAVIFRNGGSIPQIMWDGAGSKELLGAVFLYLSRNLESMNINNIPVTEFELIKELRSIGFTVLVNQYEMCIEL